MFTSSSERQRPSKNVASMPALSEAAHGTGDEAMGANAEDEVSSLQAGVEPCHRFSLVPVLPGQVWVRRERLQRRQVLVPVAVESENCGDGRRTHLLHVAAGEVGFEVGLRVGLRT